MQLFVNSYAVKWI